MVKANKVINDYLNNLPEARRDAVKKMISVIRKNMPAGFEEGFSSKMITYHVPHSKYPAGYHCKPETPLPFLYVSAEASKITFYHMGLYASPPLMKWFTEAYAKASASKLDMGKSCVRFKKPDDIPFELIGELATKMTPDEWIAMYEKNYRKK